MLLAKRRTAESSRFGGCAGQTLLFAVLLLASAPPSPVSADEPDGQAAGEPGARRPEHPRHETNAPGGALPLWVLLPGQEPIAAAMLGGTEGVAGCAFTSARIERERIVASFGCANGQAPFTVVMIHPRAWGCPGECTEKFAISVSRGSPPPGFLVALRRQVRSHEARIRWATPGGRSRASAWLLHYVPRPLPTLGLLTLVAVVALLVVERRRSANAE